MKKEERKEMDSDSNTGPAGSTQIQYRYIEKYKRVTQYKYRVRRVNSPAAAKNLSAELLPIHIRQQPVSLQ